MESWEWLADNNHAERTVDGDRPIPFRTPASRLYVEAGPLPEGVAARILRCYDGAEVQVSYALARRLRRTVARHAAELHYDTCDVVSCVAARGWLADARPVHLLTADHPAASTA